MLDGLKVKGWSHGNRMVHDWFQSTMLSYLNRKFTDISLFAVGHLSQILYLEFIEDSTNVGCFKHWGRVRDLLINNNIVYCTHKQRGSKQC